VFENHSIMYHPPQQGKTHECTVLYTRFCWMDTGKFTGVKNLESTSQM